MQWNLYRLVFNVFYVIHILHLFDKRSRCNPVGKVYIKSGTSVSHHLLKHENCSPDIVMYGRLL